MNRKSLTAIRAARRQDLIISAVLTTVTKVTCKYRLCTVSAIEPRAGRLRAVGRQRRVAEMKITMRRDTWTALAAVVGVRPSGSVGPRSDRSSDGQRRGAAAGRRGWRRRVSCCQGCCGIRGCRVRRVAARVETRERSSDPLARYRPLTHASAGDPSGAARNMPSQLFDSTHNLCPLCPSALPHTLFLFLSLSLSPLVTRSFARLSSSSSFNRACLSYLRLYLASFSVYPTRRSIFGRSIVHLFFSLSFLPPYTRIPVSVRRLSFTFSFYRAFRSSRFISSIIVARSLPSSGLTCVADDALPRGLSPAGLGRRFSKDFTFNKYIIAPPDIGAIRIILPENRWFCYHEVFPFINR